MRHALSSTIHYGLLSVYVSLYNKDYSVYIYLLWGWGIAISPQYAAAVWNANLECIAHDIVMVQHNAVRFISGFYGRDSITSALENLDLETLVARRRKTNHSLLLKFLANEENHNFLINASEDLMDTIPTNTPTIRAAAKGESRTILYAKTSAYCNRLLPRTLRKLKANITKV